MNNNCFSFKADQETINKIIDFYNYCKVDIENPNILFRGATSEFSVQIYKNNTILIQGRKAIYEYSIWQNSNTFVSHAGSDEVGTGDYFGPVVVAACLVLKDDFDYLLSLGVKDSKQLSDEKIKEIAPLIIKRVKTKISILSNNKYNQIYVTKNYNLNKIKAFLHNFVINKLIEDINIYSTRDEKILDELSYLEPAEREEKEKVLGILQGDVTLIQTKNRLQQIVNNSYDIQSPDQISMLFQLGIGSNLSAYSGYSAARMRGYLEIDEAKLDEAVRNNINDLQKIFGFDTNNDYITDNGIAFLMNEYLTSFSQQGGIIDGKIQTYDRQIAQQERDITNFNDRMEKKEADYKRQFGNMEAMYERLKDSSRALDSLNTNNRNE